MHLYKPLINIDDIINKMSEKPNSIGFEVTNMCNAKCIFCGRKHLRRPAEILPMDLFRKAIDEFDSFGGGDVGLIPLAGEPLIDPEFVEKIKYARNKKNICRIGFFTNGILINKVGARSIIRSGVDDIGISIAGFDREINSRIFGVDCWEQIYTGILELLKENSLDGDRVKVCIALRSDIPVWKALKSPVYKEIKKYKFDVQFTFRYDNWSGKITPKDLRGRMRLRRVEKKTEPCLVLYCALTILSNGTMTLCGCRDLNGELTIGNIRNKTILEAWHDPRIENIRKGFYAAQYPDVCKECTSYIDLCSFREQKIKNLLRRNN